MAFPDNRLVLYEPMPRLEDMAAINLAVNLTMNYAKHVTEHEVFVPKRGRSSIFEFFRYEQHKIYNMKPDNLIIPPVLEVMVKSRFRECCDEIERFTDFYDQFSSFDIKIVAVVRQFLPNIVWKSNGKIDHLQTAFNLLDDSRLEDVVKFHIMCTFCMEERIRNAWIEVRNHSFIETSSFCKEPLVVYWCCIMTEDFSKIGCYEIDAIEKPMLLRLKDPSRSAYFPAAEYFFNRLCVDDRIEIGADLMRHWCGWTRFLISKYTTDEQYRLFSDLVVPGYLPSIFRAFKCDRSHNYLDNALQLWNHIKHLVNGYQYLEILQEINIPAMNTDGELHEFIVEFWIATPHNLKEYILQLEEDKFMPLFVNSLNRSILRDDSFLIAVLSDADFEYRRKFWRSNWVQIVNYSQPFHLKKILNLCVSNEEMTEFRKDALSSPVIRQYLIGIIADGRILLLNDFLELFIEGGQSEIDNAKRELSKETGVDYICSHVFGCEETEEYVAALIELIRVIFGEDLKGEANFRKELILRWSKHIEIHSYNYVSKIIYVADRICEKTLLQILKNDFREEMEYLLSSEDDCDCSMCTDRDKLLLWCLGDQQESEKFKTSCEKIRQRKKEREKQRKEWLKRRKI